MADAQKIKNTAVHLKGIDELSPKLAALRETVGRFRQNLEQTGLGSLDFSGLVKGGGLAAPFVSGIQSALAFKEQVKDVDTVVAAGVPQAATQGLKQFRASMDQVSVAFGMALLPAVTAVAIGLEPLLTTVAQVLTDNPQLVQGLAAGAVAFTAVQAAVTGASQALGVMQLVLNANPVVLAATGIALAAALIVANWKPISGFFAGLWQSLSAAVQPVMASFKTLFAWSPLGLIIANWAPLTGLFTALWDLLKAVSVPVVTFMQSLFSWSPLGQIIANWGVISEVFTAIWSDFKLTALAAFAVVSGLFDWSPMAQLQAVWSPVLAWFSALADKLEVIIAPVRKLMGGTLGDAINRVTGGVVELTAEQQERNAESARNPSAFRQGPKPWGSPLAATSTTLLQQTAANNRTQLNGDLRVSFENAPAGLRVAQPETNQPGLSVTPRVGYRSLSLGGSNELA
ncbi:hypothetical protein HX787_17640 [Pseudomonas tolaasii]|uniref:Phage tail protein n=2 Tax=Pseudomonas tolaasii TaxID=29442 RepID=A0A7Y8AP10_PSETO|nr:hypothetical protein [Pseudomonas tolaasii]ARB29977.1 hypothetical protein B5P22_22675 [Pseudomonas tolaasii]KAB0476320.1 hypothetical protein F7R12_10800 [Pseudomonas tolaasii]MBY8939782.1 hypothetical protein [Pseudomonas tolaasii]NWC21179.1 hypothetical protein [Pseudomonas tolaasii]NWC39174.1 hypothetical protein [Pseudomonas tolaasii]